MLRKLLETILGEGLYGKIREWRNSSRWVADSYFRYNNSVMDSMFICDQAASAVRL